MSSVVSSASSVMNGASVGQSSGRANMAGYVGDSSPYNASTTSPLQIFVRAKKKINDIFQEIEEYVAESAVFVEGDQSSY